MDKLHESIEPSVYIILYYYINVLCFFMVKGMIKSDIGKKIA